MPRSSSQSPSTDAPPSYRTSPGDDGYDYISVRNPPPAPPRRPGYNDHTSYQPSPTQPSPHRFVYNHYNTFGAPPSERDLLTPRSEVSRAGTQKASDVVPLWKVIVFIIGIVFATSYFCVWVTRDPLDPAMRERMRRVWDRERLNHQMEVNHMEELRALWEIENRDHDEMRRNMAREMEQWDADRRDRQRQWDQEAQQKEQKQQEEDERKRAGLHWQNLRGNDHCAQYGTRRYTAQLGGIPTGYDALQLCRETPVDIHGVTLPSPTYCEEQKSCGGVFAHWLVDFDESSCATYWSDFKDKGCTTQGSGLRRFESNLQNLQQGDDWHEMCSTTPANFRGMHFNSPTSCADWGKHGYWGIWEVPDSWCN